jgi:predicted nucleic acid-binding protein
MNARVFFDTNVPLYMLSGNTVLADRAETLISAGGVVSVQVLNEFASVASKKLRMNWAEIREFLEGLRAACEVVPLTEYVHKQGLAIAERHKLSVYDSMIWAAAILSGCTLLYSQDMRHGLKIGDTLLQNPFFGENP